MDLFGKEIKKGLQNEYKSINHKFIFNRKGHELFSKLMKVPSYYMSKCEPEIFRTHKETFLSYFGEKFNLIDLGVGNGEKTRILLDYFISQKFVDITYFPVDICKETIENVTSICKRKYRELEIIPIDLEYSSAIETISKIATDRRKVFIFLGNAISNLSHTERMEFFNWLSKHIKKDDLVLTGFDLDKNPNVILENYNSKEITNFMMNAIIRLNDELNANFDISQFDYFYYYNPITRIGNFYLISCKSQIVHIKDLDFTVNFKQWDTIDVGETVKFSSEQIKRYANETGFDIIDNFYDNKKYYVTSLWKLK